MQTGKGRRAEAHAAPPEALERDGALYLLSVTSARARGLPKESLWCCQTPLDLRGPKRCWSGGGGTRMEETPGQDNGCKVTDIRMGRGDAKAPHWSALDFLVLQPHIVGSLRLFFLADDSFLSPSLQLKKIRPEAGSSHCAAPQPVLERPLPVQRFASPDPSRSVLHPNF